jgi:ATP synthase protein I
LASGLRKLAAVQLLLVAGVSVIFFMFYGGIQAVAAGYGGMVAMANGLLLEWRRHGADSGPALSAGASLRLLYRTVIERWVLVIGLFALGMGILRLDPPALLAGFIAGQLGLLTNRTGRKN